jgi:hypothetical protein
MVPKPPGPTLIALAGRVEGKRAGSINSTASGAGNSRGASVHLFGSIESTANTVAIASSATIRTSITD